MRNALVSHDSLYIREVQIDDGRNIDQVCDTLYGLLKHFVRFLESFGKCSSAIHDLKKPVIGDYDQSIDVLLDVLDTNESSLHAALSLKAERLCHYADSEDAHFLRDPCNDGSSSGSCAAAHTAGNEYHIRTLESLSDLISTLFRCLLTNLRIRTGAKALRQLLTDLQQSGSPAKVQSLNISVDTDEFHTYNIYIHHSVNSVVACTANANDYNLASR